MAASVKIYPSRGLIIVIFGLFTTVSGVYYIQKQSPSDCKKRSIDEYHQFFDISQLRCIDCSETNVFQTVSADGLRCVCQKGMKLTEDFGGAKIKCEPCGKNQFVASNGWECLNCTKTDNPDPSTCSCTSTNEITDAICKCTSYTVYPWLDTGHLFQATSGDGWTCLTCSSQNPYNLLTNECQTCSEDSVPIERTLDGTATGERTCRRCAAYTSPDASGRRCTRCNQVLSVLGSTGSCTCPTSQFSGGVCFKQPSDLIDENAELYKVRFTPELEVNSAYFIDNIRAARAMCDPKYANLTACQVLGNLCTLIMYTRRQASTACTAYLTLTGDSNRDLNEWPANMPWLYYLEDTADQVLRDTRITTQFTFPSSTLNFQVAAYTLNGTYLGMRPVTNGLLQICKSSRNIMDAAYSFGTTYSQSCTISVRDLWDEDKYPLIFYEMFLEMEGAGGQKQLYAIPVLIDNYEDPNEIRVNQNANRLSWQLVRRFFLVDSVSGRTVPTAGAGAAGAAAGQASSQQSNLAKAVRYAESMTIQISLQENTNDGRIYPPYLRIKYAVATDTDYSSNKNVDISFSTSYSMNLEKYNQDVSIATGVLGGLAVVYAVLQTWGWSRRAGRINMDFMTIAKFLLFSICNLSNVFFVVSFGVSLWWLIFYKRQTSVYLLLPDSSQEGPLIAYIATAFALKAFQLLTIVIEQITIDIFFIDWERPKGKAVDSQKSQEAPVSIWRTYFVANEWNEIQTTRKINELLQLFAVIFFLNVVGFEHMATADPRSDLRWTSDQYYSPYNKFFRYGISALIYILVATVQWVFYTFIYERFIEDKVRQYVDLCSMCNVSVFILNQSHFGYYIHGRSVHGRADTDMREMHENLKREEENLCGQRGLLPNTEQQTFQIGVPRKLRLQYDKVLIPINAPQQTAQAGRIGGGGQPGHLDVQTERSIQAYSVINRFLQAFIDHSLRDIDYLIKDKMLVESILDIEIEDASDKGIFYNDDGHSFDQVLFFGHEVTLLLFEILLFTVVDLGAQNFVLSAVITYIIMEIVYKIRHSLGEGNLARKTLVDRRFLI